MDAQLVAIAIMSAAHTPTGATMPYLGIPVSTQSQVPLRSERLILAFVRQFIPAHLVRRIRAGKYVEMRDLLSDNVALHDQLEAIQGPLVNAVTPGVLRPQVREVSSLISWFFAT